MDAAHLLVVIPFMSNEERKIARSFSQSYFTPSSIVSMLDVYNSIFVISCWIQSQMYHLNKRDYQVHQSLKSNSSTAYALYDTFTSGRDVASYLYVTFHPDDDLTFLSGKDYNTQICTCVKRLSPR